MELRHLRYFVAAAEEGNISRAAQRLHLTQPALSRQIKTLEEEVGHPLLERRANSVHLTEAGQTLLREAREVLDRADTALQRVRSSAAQRPLRIGYAPSLTMELLPSAMERFAQVHPRVRVELADLSSAEMLDGLTKGTLDLIVTATSESDKHIAWTPLCRLDVSLAMGRNHPLAEFAEITPEQVDGLPLVLFCQKDYPEYWRRVQGWFRSHGIDARVAGEYDGFCSLAAAVQAGVGAAMVVANSAALPGGIVLKPLKPAPSPIAIGVGRLVAREDDAVSQVFAKELVTSAKEAQAKA